jgi:hypothetical protein
VYAISDYRLEHSNTYMNVIESFHAQWITWALMFNTGGNLVLQKLVFYLLSNEHDIDRVTVVCYNCNKGRYRLMSVEEKGEPMVNITRREIDDVLKDIQIKFGDELPLHTFENVVHENTDVRMDAVPEPEDLLKMSKKDPEEWPLYAILGKLLYRGSRNASIVVLKGKGIFGICSQLT